MRNGSARDWLLWQLADSAFPTGGFAHSGGLEAAIQHGELTGREDFIEFLEAAICQSGRSSVPFVASAFDGAEPFSSIDSLFDAFTTNHVANRASRLQGRAFLNSAARAFTEHEIGRVRDECVDTESPTHFAPVFGLVARLLELGRDDALRLFLFGQLRGWISSAVRLGVVGPLEAQSIQARVVPLSEKTVQEGGCLNLEDTAQTVPLSDLFQGAQDRLYSRLFQS